MVHHLVFYLLPAQLPLPLLTLRGFYTFLTPVCWPTAGSLVVGLEVSVVRRLVLYLVPCSSSGACGLRGLPCNRFPWGFLTTRLLVFSWNLSLGSFLSLPMFAAGLRWLRLLLGCPPSVAWQWRLLPWFLSGTSRLTLVGLQCLWIPWYGGVPGLRVGSPVSGRVCVLPQSTILRLLSFLLVGLTFGLRAGSPASGCRRGLRLESVRAAVQPSHGSVLLLCPGFLFSGPAWCG